MSSWTFAAKVDISKLLQQAQAWRGVDDIFMEVADEVRDQVKMNIKAQGIWDTGALHDSIVSEKISGGASVHDGVAYGVYNEFGTDRMAPRPHFIPAVEKFGEIFERTFKKVLR